MGQRGAGGNSVWLAFVVSVLSNSPENKSPSLDVPESHSQSGMGVGGRKSHISDGENEAQRGARSCRRSQSESVV